MLISQGGAPEMRWLVCLLAWTCLLTSVLCTGNNTDKKEAKNFLDEYNKRAGEVFREYALKQWEVFVNNTLDTRKQLRAEDRTKASFMREMRGRALTFDPTNMSPDIQRQLAKITNIGVAAQADDAKYRELAGTIVEMEATVWNAKFCHQPPKNCLYNLPGMLTPVEGHEILAMLWTSWRNNTGRKIKGLFTKYVALSNEAVRLTGYQDLGEQWRSQYEMPDFRATINELYLQIRPLYEQVHAVARSTGKTFNLKMLPTGQIPAHMLGNMMADDWSTIANYFLLYKHHKYQYEFDYEKTEAIGLLEMADSYLVSMGFESLLPTLELVYYTEDHGRIAEYRQLAFDLLGDGDVRLAISDVGFEKAYYDGLNKLTQIHYFLQYKNQPTVYRNPINDAFLDAVGGAVEMSVRNLQYLRKKKLINKPLHRRQLINYQLDLALRLVARMPFAYVVDDWRWSVFNGSTTPENYNQVWWRLRCALQGLSPPVQREADDFDAGGLYQIAANQPYIKNFLSTILQFQILKGLCHRKKFKPPLHKCNLENKTAAGYKLRAVMKLGSSVNWKVALKQLTGSDVIDTKPMLEYFQPLLKQLKKKNADNFGWQPQCNNTIKVLR